jgi:hypothetical protein
MNDKDLFGDIRGLLQKQIKEAYLEGTRQGAITTCATLYRTMQEAGLEEDNFFYALLKNIAKFHGCDDLLAEIAIMTAKKEEKDSDELLS